MNFYNNHRPHSSLGGTPPDVFYRRIINATQPDQQVQKVAEITPETVQAMGSSSKDLLPFELVDPCFV